MAWWFASGDGNWSLSPNATRCGFRRRYRGTMSLHCCHAMKTHRYCGMNIHRRRFRASMDHHRCCANQRPILSMSRENHRVAQADSAEAHCAGPADCNEVDSVARATNSLAVLWESR